MRPERGPAPAESWGQVKNPKATAFGTRQGIRADRRSPLGRYVEDREQILGALRVPRDPAAAARAIRRQFGPDAARRWVQALLDELRGAA